MVRFFLLAALCLCVNVHAATPTIISYQGRVLANGVPFNGAGQFKFALVNGDASATFWKHDTGTTGSGEPGNTIALTVTNGLYAVKLGDTGITNMMALPATVFGNNSDVRLRIWFNDGTNGNQMLTPDERIVAVGYAMTAATVDDGAITTAKVADGAVTNAKINDVAASKITGTVSTAQIADGAVTSTKIAEQPKVKVFHSQNQTVPGNGANFILAFDSESYDIGDLHISSPNSRITCNTAGVYDIKGQVVFATESVIELRSLSLRLNGTTFIAFATQPATPNPYASSLIISTHQMLNVGDYVELIANQTSGVNITLPSAFPTFLMMARLP